MTLFSFEYVSGYNMLVCREEMKTALLVVTLSRESSHSNTYIVNELTGACLGAPTHIPLTSVRVSS